MGQINKTQFCKNDIIAHYKNEQIQNSQEKLIIKYNLSCLTYTPVLLRQTVEYLEQDRKNLNEVLAFVDLMIQSDIDSNSKAQIKRLLTNAYERTIFGITQEWHKVSNTDLRGKNNARLDLSYHLKLRIHFTANMYVTIIGLSYVLGKVS